MIADGLRLAAGTLTVARVQPPSRVDRPVAGVAMALGWLVVLPLAVLVGLLGRAATAVGAPPLLAAAVVLGVLALSSRGLHLDGLADTADGLASSYDRERALVVMRAGDVGPAGAATLVLTLLVQAAAVAVLVGRPALVAACVVVSRGLLVVACARGVPPARPDGLGAAVAGSVPRAAVALVLVALAAATAGAATLDTAAWWVGPAALVGALAAAVAVVVRCMRRLGGVTGDVLGAVVEFGFAAALVTAAVGAGAGT